MLQEGPVQAAVDAAAILAAGAARRDMHNHA
jgi:hypothetical protein